MRNLLALFAAAILLFFGIGYYLNWYKIEKVETSTGREQISIDIDKKKIAADVHRGAERGADKVQKLLESQREAEKEAVTAADKPKGETQTK